ncbi:NAD-dependent epimerase/dehydratase [Emericellopsis atlantica]|uniref:NAD-dependent epimerase/dehydratase n=1 Tax=Emericellopsis atlantica TaxID=2614577 RepID=A0A9P7ZLF1_9HYPO|nr:NAD-dependent epimerase/dehydratase [Emericellopsis atlantica]KAG9253760.1 NAD-dependent epimerase/dehydratase [Emericellopsis atlantica]
MKFLIIGGSGRSGQLVIEEALSKGHQVTALVRNPAPLEEREGLTIVKGSPLNVTDIARALETKTFPFDAVFFTLNARRVSDSPFAAADPVNSPPRLMADSVRNAIAAMRGATPPVPKIVVMSAAGTGSSFKNLNFLIRLVFTHTNMRLSREDHDAVDKELRDAQGIRFVEVRPHMLTDAEAADVKVYPDDGKGAGFMPKVSRASVARFMVQAAESSEYDGKAPIIAN